MPSARAREPLIGALSERARADVWFRLGAWRWSDGFGDAPPGVASLCLVVVRGGHLLVRPLCFASFSLGLLVSIEVSHGVSCLIVLSCFARVGLALAAGFGVDPLGCVFVQVFDDD